MVWLGCIACLKKYYLKLDDLCLIEPSSNRKKKKKGVVSMHVTPALGGQVRKTASSRPA
jgi:hypothetical protein